MARAKKKKEVVEAVIKTTESNEETVIQIEPQEDNVSQAPFVQEYDESVYSPINISHMAEVNSTEDGTVATYAAISTDTDIKADKPKEIVKPKKITKYPIYGDFTYNWNGQCIEY